MPNLYNYTYAPWQFVQGDADEPLRPVLASGAKLRKPPTWNKQARLERERHANMTASKPYQRPRVFLGVDPFADDVPSEWRTNVLTLMDQCAELHWLAVTEHPENVVRMCGICCNTHGFPKHVCIGTKVYTQAEADARIPHLLSIPAKTRFVWVEPSELIDLDQPTCPTCGNHDVVLGDDGATPFCPEHEDEMCFGAWLDPCADESQQGVNWLICAGNDKPIHPQWVRQLRDQAQAASVPFWFDGWGEWSPAPIGGYRVEDVALWNPKDSNDWVYLRDLEADRRDNWDEHHDGDVRMYKTNKAKSGRLLDGREWTEVLK